MKRMRRMIVLLALLALLVPVATAATPSDVVVDGDPNSLDPAVEWPADSWVKDDLDDPGISDQYNIRDVYATNSQTTTTPYHFIRYNTKSNILINWNSATSVYYDIDGDPSTGMTLTCPEGESIGADRKVSWRMQRDQCDIFTYNSGTKWFDRISGNCDGGPSGDGQKDATCVEIKGLADDLDISGPEFAVYMHFENDHPDPDDVVCFTYDVPTAVELSSFSATSQSRSADEPGLTWLWPVGLVSGVVAVSAGGLVLWRRKGPAR